MILLEWIEHVNLAQRVEYQTCMAELPGSILTGVTFCCWSFLFLGIVADLLNFLDQVFAKLSVLKATRTQLFQTTVHMENL